MPPSTVITEPTTKSPARDARKIAVSGFGLPSQALPAHELWPALYACEVRDIELLERLEPRAAGPAANVTLVAPSEPRATGD